MAAINHWNAKPGPDESSSVTHLLDDLHLQSEHISSHLLHNSKSVSWSRSTTLIWIAIQKLSNRQISASSSTSANQLVQPAWTNNLDKFAYEQLHQAYCSYGAHNRTILCTKLRLSVAKMDCHFGLQWKRRCASIMMTKCLQQIETTPTHNMWFEITFAMPTSFLKDERPAEQSLLRPPARQEASNNQSYACMWSLITTSMLLITIKGHKWATV